MTVKAKNATKKKWDVNTGDNVFIWKSGSYLNGEPKRELVEGIVMEVNTASIYVQCVERNTKLRFDKRSGKLRDGYGGYFELFSDPNEFYERWDNNERLLQLRREIKEFTESASSEILKQVHAIYTKEQKE